MVRLSQEDVQQSLQQLFQNTSEELSSQAVREATDQTTRLLFKLFDRWWQVIQHEVSLHLCVCV